MKDADIAAFDWPVLVLNETVWEKGSLVITLLPKKIELPLRYKSLKRMLDEPKLAPRSLTGKTSLESKRFLMMAFDCVICSGGGALLAVPIKILWLLLPAIKRISFRFAVGK